MTTLTIIQHHIVALEEVISKNVTFLRSIRVLSENVKFANIALSVIVDEDLVNCIILFLVRQEILSVVVSNLGCGIEVEVDVLKELTIAAWMIDKAVLVIFFEDTLRQTAVEPSDVANKIVLERVPHTGWDVETREDGIDDGQIWVLVLKWLAIVQADTVYNVFNADTPLSIIDNIVLILESEETI